MTFETVNSFAHSWGAIYFVVMFLGALVYVFWPRNKATFDKAARTPLEEDETP
jgi:cytochrome c oxidase cbb3-type subunit 4